MADTTGRTYPGYFPPVPRELRASLLQVPIDDDEQIQVVCANIHPTVTITFGISGRYWSDRERQIKPIDQTVQIAAGALGLTRVQLDRGALLDFRVLISAGTGAVLGDGYVFATLIKSLTGAITGRGTIVQGYCSGFSHLSWPASRLESSHEGKGAIRYFNNWTNITSKIAEITVPALRRWRVITGNCVLITDATVGNRSVEVQIVHGGNVVYSGEATPNQGANLSFNYQLVPSTTATAAAPFRDIAIPFVPDLELVAGDIVRFRADQGFLNPVGDGFTAQFLIVREWFDPAS